MPLASPIIGGPVSTCSTHVLVEGHLTGARISIYRNGDLSSPIGSITATWPFEYVELDTLPASGLEFGDQLVATQEHDGETSLPTSMPVTVQRFDPRSLNQGSVRSHLYVCGRHLLLEGLVPGAEIAVGPGGSRGKGQSVDGTSRISIDPPLRNGEILQFVQTACGQTGPLLSMPMPDPTPLVNQRLLSPEVGIPLHACERVVAVRKVVEGADLTLIRNGTPYGTFGSAFPNVNWLIPESPLVAGEKISARQSMDLCDIPSSPVSSPPITVLAAEEAPVPQIEKPLCENATVVRVLGIAPGIKVRILVDGVEWAVGESTDYTCSFDVPPLPAGGRVTAQQERCDVYGEESSPVIVGSTPALIAPPRIVENPLFACGTVIAVQNVYRGAWIRTLSTTLGQISAWEHVTSPDAALNVNPPLLAGDEVHIEQTSCGGNRTNSDPVTVVTISQLAPVKAQEPVIDGDSFVRISPVVPGARVEVYVDGAFVDAVNDGKQVVVVQLEQPLRFQQRVNARQILCGNVSQMPDENDAIVKRPAPLPPTSLSPNSGTFDQRPSFSWRDPRAGTIGDANQFDLEIRVDGNLQISITQSSKTFTPSADFPFSSEIEWRVRAENSTGKSGWSDARFVVESPPPPPAPYPVFPMDICSGTTVPEGWIKVDDKWDPTKCGSPTSIISNVWRIQKIDELPIGSFLEVCADAPTPPGWVVTDRLWRPTRCGRPTS